MTSITGQRISRPNREVKKSKRRLRNMDRFI